MKIDLSQQRAVVSGSARGIGFSIVMGLARAGAQVVLNGRNAASVNAALARARELLPAASVSGVTADLATADGVDAFIRQVGDADILVNNLGVYEDKPFGNITDPDWQRFFDTNVMSGVRLARYYFPQMIDRNRGRVIFISSESAITTPAARIHYGVTKTAQLALARGLAEMTAGTRVTVNSVIVGPTLTDPVRELIRKRAQEQGVTEAEVERKIIDEVRPTSLIKRLVTDDEVANLVVYCASEQAAATNGAVLRVEGGGIRSIL